MKTLCEAKIISNKKIAPGIMDMTLSAPEIALSAKPGQFINMYTGRGEYILPRPISICDFDPEKGVLRLIYSIVGKGTEIFSSLKEGENIKILGPLGNGFEIADTENSILVAGGIGAPPLLGLCKRLKGNIEVYLGARDKNILTDEFKSTGAKVFLSSDNGKEGFKGNVAELLKQNNANGDIIYTCGPKIMLKFITAYAEEKNIPVQVSMEERMACGIGACVGCAVKIKQGGDWSNLKVCKDGPVFDGREVLWD